MLRFRSDKLWVGMAGIQRRRKKQAGGTTDGISDWTVAKLSRFMSMSGYTSALALS